MDIGHSAFSDKSGSLIVGGGHYRLGNSLASNLHNPDFSSQILECPGKPSVESQVDSESKEGLESSFSESKQLTESTTPKNPSEALPNINNSACASTSRAESKDLESLDSAIFAEQKSNKICSASAHTDTRPCRGGENQKQGGSSATADFSKETSFCLDKDKRGSPAKRYTFGCRKSGGFFGALASGEGITPLFAKKQNDFENLGSIRENTTLRNLESTESKADSESKAENLGSTESKTFTESSPTDSKVITESKEILNNEQRQSPSGVEPRFKVLELDSESSSTDSKAITESKKILNNAQRQNLSDTESNADLESNPIDSQTSTESSEILKTHNDRI